VQDDGLFPEDYPNTLVVPLTHDRAVAYPSFALRIDPAPENGVTDTSWALSHHVTNVSLLRVKETPSRVTADQLEGIRRRIALALGLPSGL